MPSTNQQPPGLSSFSSMSHHVHLGHWGGNQMTRLKKKKTNYRCNLCIWQQHQWSIFKENLLSTNWCSTFKRGNDEGSKGSAANSFKCWFNHQWITSWPWSTLWGWINYISTLVQFRGIKYYYSSHLLVMRNKNHAQEHASLKNTSPNELHSFSSNSCF